MVLQSKTAHIFTLILSLFVYSIAWCYFLEKHGAPCFSLHIIIRFNYNSKKGNVTV